MGLAVHNHRPRADMDSLAAAAKSSCGAATIAHALSSHSQLQNVDMSWNRLAGAGGFHFSELIQLHGCRLTHLCLAWTSLDVTGAIELASALSSRRVVLKVNSQAPLAQVKPPNRG